MSKSYLCLIGAAGLALCSSAGNAADFDGVCMTAPLKNQQSADSIVVRVSNEPELQQALVSARKGSVIVLAAGEYKLTSTLWIKTDNVTIRGDSNRCDDVVLVGKGMEVIEGQYSVPHGIWTNAAKTRIQNLTIKNIYHHAISIDASAAAPEIYNVRMIDTGEQFVKSNTLGFGNGVDNGMMEYSTMLYSASPPHTDHGGGSGYTGGISLHAGNNWLISNNRFENFHTPDTAENLWNPAVLIWNGAANSIVENNQFVDVDRAIAFGLVNRPGDHSGGIIRNNMIAMRPNLFSRIRKLSSDAAILVWSSPSTHVLHNTVITNGNTNNAIELRYDSSGAVVRNNLVDESIVASDYNMVQIKGNISHNGSEIFRNILSADLHLKSAVTGISGVAPLLENAAKDFDGDSRGNGSLFTAVGADEYRLAGNIDSQ